MNQLIEIRSLNLKPGMREEFQRLYIEDAFPLLKRWNFDIVANGPSLHEENLYYVSRRFDGLAEREQSEDAYYAGDEWRQGPREVILALIENRFAGILSLNWMRTLCRGCEDISLGNGEYGIMSEIRKFRFSGENYDYSTNPRERNHHSPCQPPQKVQSGGRGNINGY